MRPHLAPGLHVLRRPDARLQVGLERERAAVLPDTPALRRDLRLLTRGELAAEAVPEAVEPLLRRPEPSYDARVFVAGFGHPAGRVLQDRLVELVGQSGLTPGRTTGDVVVLAGAGEPCRSLVDGLAQQGTPHLVVRLVEGHAEIGPFVVPGVTACLRCTDAFATDEDDAWPLLLEQYTRQCVRDRADGAGEPVDPVLASLAAAWAVRDVTSYVLGRRPSTWSSSIRLDALLRDLRTVEWLRHPACGCAWTMDG